MICNDRWEYIVRAGRAHQCRVEADVEDDNVKHTYHVRLPEDWCGHPGDEVQPDLDCYHPSREIVEAWIDAGYPVLHAAVDGRLYPKMMNLESLLIAVTWG